MFGLRVTLSQTGDDGATDNTPMNPLKRECLEKQARVLISPILGFLKLYSYKVIKR
jgi:hypothetical protein